MEKVRIYRSGSLPTKRASEGNFTGDVYIGNYFECEKPSRLHGATATFIPGARTPWKVNPLGQTLIITEGIGWAQCQGEDIFEIRAGDIVQFPPEKRHWEGATPNSTMVYIAIQETMGGSSVRFFEMVTDDEYSMGGSIFKGNAEDHRTTNKK